LFDLLPKKNRPRCTKLDASGCCPKGVPKIAYRNDAADGVLEFLLTNKTSSISGLVEFDLVLVTEIASLLGMGQQERDELLAKSLYLVNEVNLSHLKAKMVAEEAKSGK
jgi:hypothetical protein